MSTIRWELILVAAAAALGAGCTGRVGGGDNGAPAPAMPGDQPGRAPGASPPANTPADQPGTAVFRRLTRTEYNNTVRDLLGDGSAPANLFPPDTDAGKSGFARGGSISAVDAGRLLEASEALATAAVKRLDTLLPCKGTPAAAADQDRCAQQFIIQFGRRAYRRPLTPDETRGLTDYYNQQRTQGQEDFPGAIRMVIAATLMSPRFLYHWELAPAAAIKDGAFVRYNPHELAARLSYLLYASMPDEALFAAVDAGKLSTPDDIERQARRMITDPRARDAVADFFIQWLGIAQLPDMIKDTTVFKDYTPALAQAMIAETREFVSGLMVGGDGKLATLLTSTTSTIDPGLARLYKVPGVTATGPRMLDGSQRAGIMTQASFLASHATASDSHPVKRGKLVADRLLCQDLPLPPDNVPDPKPAAADLPTRQRYAEHSASPCASACHSIIDPLGFAFEKYDAIGGFRTVDGGQPVDASGTVLLGGQQRPFKDAIELVNLLARSDEVRDCMGAQWLRFALRRQDGPGDAASLASAKEAFRKSSYDIRELIVGLTRTHSFTHRLASMGEVLP